MNIRQIKYYLASKIGAKIVVIYYGSRNRKERYEGVVYKLYYNIFTIKLNNGDIKSFNYIDILTKNIQIYM
ncbi:MAG: hypothetical protein MR835_03005 [Erysipelotrichaceae bacterium]|nr:hypothetical protein [Erysipelotrichaceae bacterium]MDY3934168.1 Veg family protein [Bacilli bacterium]